MEEPFGDVRWGTLQTGMLKLMEAIRLMAIERVREGEAPADVIVSYGFNRTTIYKWINVGKQAQPV